MRQILASFSQGMKSSSKQWVQILVVVKKQKYLVKWMCVNLSDENIAKTSHVKTEA